MKCPLTTTHTLTVFNQSTYLPSNSNSGWTKTSIMEDVKDVSIAPLAESPYIKPVQMKYTQVHPALAIATNKNVFYRTVSARRGT